MMISTGRGFVFRERWVDSISGGAGTTRAQPEGTGAVRGTLSEIVSPFWSVPNYRGVSDKSH